MRISDWSSDVCSSDLLRYEAALLPRREVSSVFFGGGTPSLMPPETVAAVIAATDAAWGLTGDCEITLEANPNSVEVATFAALVSAGVNRVSIGVQSRSDEHQYELQALMHNSSADLRL